jgi:hypothetical protein
MRHKLYALIGLLIIVMAASVAAQESAEQPPMGPPPEMQQLEPLVGVWDVQMKMGMNPDTTTWESSTGACTYAYILDGAALEMDYQGTAMGMPYSGLGLQTFDRETGKWQVTWTDNMGARTSIYTGTMENGKTVVTGEDLYNGETYITRISTFNHTKNSFTWTMDFSMDGGKTFQPSAVATYTRHGK